MIENVDASMYVLQRDSLFDTVKPYHLKFEPPEGFPRENTVMIKRDGIPVQDIRGIEHEFSVSRNGFGLMNLDLPFDVQRIDDEEWIKSAFVPDLARSAKEFLGASRVQVFDYKIRKSEKQFPISTGEPYQYQQPATVLHIDSTPNWTSSLVDSLNEGNEAERLKTSRYEYVNIWVPLRGPVRKWPLALCDNTTVDVDSDLQARDLVYEYGVVESFLAHDSYAYRFYYLRDQQPTEAWIMVQSDSHSLRGVLHTSFYNPHADEKDPERESIEVRALVYYENGES